MIVTHDRDDIVSSTGSLHVCAGHEAGCESLIHAMRTVYEEVNNNNNNNNKEQFKAVQGSNWSKDREIE